MHSYVFQLSSSPISSENYPSEDSVFTNIINSLGTNAVDYVEELSEKERCEAITNLVCKWLPSELFETNADGTFSYTGGLEEWIKKVYIPKIQYRASLLHPNKVFGLGAGSAYEVEKAINNPLNLDSLFIIDHGNFYSYAMRSGTFIEEFVKFLSPGDRIYIGAVFGYKF